MKIALVGNQNSGKTTLFNVLTGMNAKIGNWPGVTIEKKTGIIKGTKHEITDLPGIYSLSPYSVEEDVSRKFIFEENPDVIINIVDSTSLERSLYLTTQLLELDSKVIVALNMVDILEKKGLAINEQKLELHRIELSKNNIMPQLEDLAQVEEELVSTEEEYDDLMKKNNSMIVVKQALEDAYEKMKSDVTPIFTTNLSDNISKISDGKYNRVSINDENGMMVELESGELVPAERLSLGTIDQLYLSLRLSMNTEVSTENMPVILDEAFAYYDEDRLENVLKYLADNYKDKQIIILTCTNREEEIYKKLGYEVNKVKL